MDPTGMFFSAYIAVKSQGLDKKKTRTDDII